MESQPSLSDETTVDKNSMVSFVRPTKLKLTLYLEDAPTRKNDTQLKT